MGGGSDPVPFGGGGGGGVVGWRLRGGREKCKFVVISLVTDPHFRRIIGSGSDWSTVRIQDPDPHH